MFVNEAQKEVCFGIAYAGARWETVRGALDLVAEKTRDRSTMSGLVEAPVGGIFFYAFDAQIQPWAGYGTRVTVQGFADDAFGDRARKVVPASDTLVFIADADAELTQRAWSNLVTQLDWRAGLPLPLVLQAPPVVPPDGLRRVLGLSSEIPVIPSDSDAKGVFDGLKKATALAIAAARAR